MKDPSGTNQELIEEISALKQRIRNLEQQVSEHSKAEETLRESEARYRLAFESTCDGIFTVDRDFGITSITPSVERQLGYKVEEVINKPIQDLNILTPESLTRALSDVIQVLSGVEATGKVYEFIAKDGTIKIGEVTGTPIIREDKIIGVTAIVRDITDRKLAEEDLKKTLDELESRVRERTRELEETNTTLRVLIKKGDRDRKRLQESLQSNVNQLVTPFLSKVRASHSSEERQTYLNILETNLNNIISPFINRLSAAYRRLTPKELQIAELIRQGKKSSEIADFFGISVGTVITHRNNIRKKLDLRSKDANLRSHLLSLG